MRVILSCVVPFLLGVVLAILLEPVALITNKCYHNEIHQGLRVELWVAMTDSNAFEKASQQMKLRSWSMWLNHKQKGVHNCYED